MGKHERVDAFADGVTALTARHGANVLDRLRGAARQIVEEDNSQVVAQPEVARRVGVSAAEAYRHFASREDLLAAVAAEGFDELAAELDAAAHAGDPLISLGLAYVDFATTKRGLFGLMFGPLLAERAKYPALDKAATAMLEAFDHSLAAVEDRPADDSPNATAAWGLVRGLSNLVVEGGGRDESAKHRAQRVLSAARRSKQGHDDPVQMRAGRERWKLN